MEIRVNLTVKQQEDIAANLPVKKLLEIAMTKCFISQDIETGHKVREILEELNSK